MLKVVRLVFVSDFRQGRIIDVSAKPSPIRTPPALKPPLNKKQKEETKTLRETFSKASRSGQREVQESKGKKKVELSKVGLHTFEQLQSVFCIAAEHAIAIFEALEKRTCIAFRNTKSSEPDDNQYKSASTYFF
jgi:hypothetical protein